MGVNNMKTLTNKLGQKCELEFEYEGEEDSYFSGGFNVETGMELSNDEVEWFNSNHQDALFELANEYARDQADSYYEYVKEGN
jgi:hypothetical protein